MPEDNKRSARRLWVWPVAVLVSFPIGGYLADLVVDGVDSAGAALVGGLIAGLIIGAAEWFALRRWVSWLWIAATSIGMAVGLTAGAALVDYGISRGDLMLMGAVTGLGVGALQALVLARSRVSGALWWAVANPPAWALCWLVTKDTQTAGSVVSKSQAARRQAAVQSRSRSSPPRRSPASPKTSARGRDA